MFMTYLMREIEQPNVFIKTALNNLLRRFRQEIPDSLRNQIPQVTFTLAEDLSLHDPVDTTYVGKPTFSFSFFLLSTCVSLISYHVEQEQLLGTNCTKLTSDGLTYHQTGRRPSCGMALQSLCQSSLVAWTAVFSTP